MASIIYKSLSTLTPVELKYEYYKNEELQASTVTYKDGISFYNVEGFNNFRDLTINRDSCLVLTSAINLSSVFTSSQDVGIGKLPGSVYLQPRGTTIYYVHYDLESNTFYQELTSTTQSYRSQFYIQPLPNSNEVEIFVDGKYLQVDQEYPYVVRLNERSLDPESIDRQRFEVIFQNNIITIKTKTNSGYRYLALNSDNTLRATGLVMNESVINDYVLKGIPVTNPSLTRGFTPTNNWVTYYYDVEQATNNKNLAVNKNILPVPTNLLVDFPIEKAAETGTVNINIANLKTGVTPAGGPAPVNNSYTKQVITKN
jgi:hypothetical protein